MVKFFRINNQVIKIDLITSMRTYTDGYDYRGIINIVEIEFEQPEKTLKIKVKDFSEYEELEKILLQDLPIIETNTPKKVKIHKQYRK